MTTHLEFIVETQERVDELGELLNKASAELGITISSKGAWRESGNDWGKYEFHLAGKNVGRYEFKLVNGAYSCVLDFEAIPLSIRSVILETVGSKFQEIKQSPAYN